MEIIKNTPNLSTVERVTPIRAVTPPVEHVLKASDIEKEEKK